MARVEDTPDLTLTETVIEKLSGGDLRSDGGADEVAKAVKVLGEGASIPRGWVEAGG